MKKKKTVSYRNITAFMIIFLLLICTACAKKQDGLKTTVEEIPIGQDTMDPIKIL